MKKFFLVLVIAVLLFVAGATKVSAASNSSALPTRFTFALEWLNLNLLTWTNQSKVMTMNDYAGKRVAEISTAVSTNNNGAVPDLAGRYQTLEKNLNTILANKSITGKNSLLDQIQSSILDQQKTLSEVRQNLTDEAVRNAIVEAQKNVVNQTRSTVNKVVGQSTADDFSNKIVSVWRDPGVGTSENSATRVYAEGTAAGSNANDGVVIDGGTAKITQDNSGNLNIVYAPGTGPDSTVNAGGQAIWKIVQSDGSVIESYTTAGKVVVGQAGGVASNIVVVGGQSGAAQSTTSGSASHVVVGGKVNQTGQASSSSAGQTVVGGSDSNSTNSSNNINSGNQLNNTSGSGSTTVATPIPQQSQE